MRWRIPVALSRVPTAIFRRMHASPGESDTESVSAGTPRTSTRNLTLSVGLLRPWLDQGKTAAGDCPMHCRPGFI